MGQPEDDKMSCNGRTRTTYLLRNVCVLVRMGENANLGALVFLNYDIITQNQISLRNVCVAEHGRKG